MKSRRPGIEGKKIWLTGGARGVGRAIAEGLISSQCGGIAIVDILPEVEGRMLCSKLSNEETKVVYYECDVRDANGVESSLRAAMRELSGVDIVINNAGIIDEDSLERCLAVNLQGVVNGTEAAVRLGVARVVNMGSAAGVFGLGVGPFYSASKHAVVGYSRSIGEGLKGKISVCCVCPGFVDCGIGIGWKDESVGLMKVEKLVEFFLDVVEKNYGDGRVFYVSQKIGGREVRTDIRTRVETRARL